MTNVSVNCFQYPVLHIYLIGNHDSNLTHVCVILHLSPFSLTPILATQPSTPFARTIAELHRITTTITRQNHSGCSSFLSSKSWWPFSTFVFSFTVAIRFKICKDILIWETMFCYLLLFQLHIRFWIKHNQDKKDWRWQNIISWSNNSIAWSNQRNQFKAWSGKRLAI